MNETAVSLHEGPPEPQGGLVEELEHKIRESRSGPQFPDRHMVRRVAKGPWYEGHTKEQALATLKGQSS